MSREDAIAIKQELTALEANIRIMKVIFERIEAESSELHNILYRIIATDTPNR